MNENWNEIVEILHDSQKNSTKDELKSFVENILRVLGWRKSNSSMVVSYVTPTGSIIDMVLQIVRKSETDVVAVVCINPTGMEDIDKAMTSARAQSALVFSNSISLWHKVEENDYPTKILDAQITEEDEDGILICELLSHRGFDKYKLSKQCCSLINKRAKHNVRKAIDTLIANPTHIKSLLKSSLLELGLMETCIEEELSNVHVDIYRGSKKQNNVSNANTSFSHDNTKFSLNGSPFYSKRMFVWNTIRQYIADHPDVTFSQLQDVFPSRIISKKRGVVQLYDTVLEWSKDNSDILTRFCTKEGEILTLCDGTKIVVNSQWGTRFPLFLPIAQSMYDVKSDKPYQYELSKEVGNPKNEGITISIDSLKTFAQKTN